MLVQTTGRVEKYAISQMISEKRAGDKAWVAGAAGEEDTPKARQKITARLM